MAKQPIGYINPETHEFTPMKKKKKVWTWILVAVFAVGILYAAISDANDEKTAPAAETTAETEAEQDAPETAAPKEETDVKIGGHTVDGVYLNYTGNVRNDTTGKWIIATCSDAKNPSDMAAALCKEFHLEKGGVLWIVNFALNTTTRISHMGAYIDVGITEYVDGEEHDAKSLGTGESYGTEIVMLAEETP